MPRTLRDLRRDIHRYIDDQERPEGFGPLTMPDLLEKSQECQRRINALGYHWDSERQLWRAPQPRDQ